MIWRRTPEHAALWDAVNRIVVASGGSSANTSVRRQKAVVEVEAVVEAALVRARADALREAATICLAEIALTPFDATSHVAKAALKRAAKKIRAEAERIERGGR